MAKQSSFDIVSKVDLAEVKNAVNQATKEATQRYDLKKAKLEIELIEAEHRLVITASDEYARTAVIDILQSKLFRRGVPLAALTHGKVEPSAGGGERQSIALQHGIPTEKAREIVKLIKQMKLKQVQAAINDDMVRVSGKDRDSLQAVIAELKAADLGIDMQFTNYR